MDLKLSEHLHQCDSCWQSCHCLLSHDGPFVVGPREAFHAFSMENVHISSIPIASASMPELAFLSLKTMMFLPLILPLDTSFDDHMAHCDGCAPFHVVLASMRLPQSEPTLMNLESSIALSWLGMRLKVIDFSAEILWIPEERSSNEPNTLLRTIQWRNWHPDMEGALQCLCPVNHVRTAARICAGEAELNRLACIGHCNVDTELAITPNMDSRL